MPCARRKPGHTTRARYDQSLQKLRTAESQIEAAQARLRTARDRVGYTELRADAPGSVTAKSAEPGEVVRAGQTIVQVTRKDGKDAVFDLPAQLMRSAPHDPLVAVHLADNKEIRATGRVRELAPQADPATRTHQVKVGLIDPPADMLLGATVVGTIVLNAEPSIEVPGVALTRSDGKPAVWVVDGTSSTVSLRAVTVARYGEATVIVSGGLEDGDVVVTAGVHVLRPGQKVKRADAPQ
jgi:membrane fusion protein, multidrug efflux system